MRSFNLGAVDSYVVYSDIHLRSPTDHQLQILIKSLESIHDTQMVVFLGDVFDFIFGGQEYYWNRWKPLWDALEILKSKKIKLCFVEGNHDFGFEHLPLKQYQNLFDILGDGSIHLNHSKLGSMTLLHSDHLVCPWHYPIFRKFVKSNWFQLLASLIPGKVTDRLFSQVARVSRGQEYSQVMTPEFVATKLQSVLRNSHAVIGHVHMNIDQEFYGHKLLCGPDWLSVPSLLKITPDGSITRVFLK